MTKITSNRENVTYITYTKMTYFIYISRKEELSQNKKQKEMVILAYLSTSTRS